MRTNDIEELIRLVEKSEISELELCEGRRRIRISKNGHSAAAGPPVGSPVRVPANPPAVAAETGPDAEAEALALNLKEITSPMVGTFYRAPAPGADTFVEVGQGVSVGQTVCIVEAMKLMNEISSDFSGVVRDIFVENGQPVEFGQPLFSVEIK